MKQDSNNVLNNSLWPGDVIWQYRSGSTYSQVIASLNLYGSYDYSIYLVISMLGHQQK